MLTKCTPMSKGATVATVRVVIHVDPVLALRANKPSGDQPFELSDHDRAKLTPAERQALADALEDGHSLGLGYRVVSSETGRAEEHDDVKVADASLASLRAILTARAQVLSSEALLQQHLKVAADDWIARNGNDEQREQWSAGQLSAVAVKHLARAQLFAPLSAFRRMPRLRPSDVCEKIRRKASCKCSVDRAWGQHSRVEFETKTLRSFREAKGLSASRIEAYRERCKAIKAAAPKGARVEIVLVSGKCNGCPCAERSYGVLVTIDWKGVPLSLRYALSERESGSSGEEGGEEGDVYEIWKE